LKLGDINTAVGEEKAPDELCKAGLLASRPFFRVLDGPSHLCNSREVVGTRFPEVATVADEDIFRPSSKSSSSEEGCESSLEWRQLVGAILVVFEIV
jgi:hypothetical protein